MDSVIAQTLQDIEIIVVNDVSPDNSQSIIDEYAAKDARIQCIVHSENLGLGGARNTGIKAAKGDYITFVDSDDWIDRQCYATVIEKMEAVNANLGVFSVEKFEEKNSSSWFAQSYNLPYGSTQKITAQKINQVTPTMWNKVFRSEDIQQDILRVPIHLKHEDVEFWFKYASWVKPLAIGIPRIHGALYHYRKRSDSIMANIAAHYKDYPKILYNIRDYLETEHLYSEYRSAFEKKIIYTLQCYDSLLVEYREQYCCDMRHLLEQYHLTMTKLLELDPRLAVYYIENELLRQYFLESQQDRWYRFGRLSRSRKFWTISKVLSKKLKLYSLLRPLAKIIKGVLEKK